MALFTCTICGNSYSSDTALNDHWEAAHPSLYALDKSISECAKRSSSLSQCSRCGTVVATFTWNSHVVSGFCLYYQNEDGFPDTDGAPVTTVSESLEIFKGDSLSDYPGGGVLEPLISHTTRYQTPPDGSTHPVLYTKSDNANDPGRRRRWRINPRRFFRRMWVSRRSEFDDELQGRNPRDGKSIVGPFDIFAGRIL
ncbi:hypothetical protein PM082_020213 [Marasmius tenuissimus]|nr:hypothetical protein PM082_020213 [Marasmius tenuissimus]